jgi:ABC-2 type transport system ATP-binding protein
MRNSFFVLICCCHQKMLWNPIVSSVLEINTLNKVYPRKNRPSIQAVCNLSLQLSGGQIFGLLGPNGAGKTTTIKMICGLVTPSSGTMRLCGYDVTRERAWAMKQIGAVLEGTRNVYWRLSAWQNLIYFGRLKGVGGKVLRARAELLLAEMGLLERRNDEVGQFSRGMQQKVAIACALIADPPILLLDEPTLGLDVQAARSIRERLISLAHEQGKAIVLTTHQMDIAQSTCDRIAIMSHGRLVSDYPTAELLGLFQRECYEIKTWGHMPVEGNAEFAGLTVAYENEGTILSGRIPDQAALYAILNWIRGSGFSLLSVNRVEPDLEEIFITLLERDGCAARDAE